ncbi:MAG TPA: PP2C family protein-serine/threonine phosphatase [Thermoanaerobaculia bacterium]|jgi:serine phosphatase RsbU (regulator of sigma subunit)|nr:PP2C family protein-serine/threonine phosphatase [Thermoanaerobaculia bacterium]
MPALSAGRGVASQIALFAAPRPSPRDVDVHAISEPARAFTGDFYFTHRHGNRLWMAIGDVAGKGVHAAVVMAMIQEELERRIVSCATADCDPATTIQRLHLFLRDLLPRNRFATAVIAQIHDDGTLIVANGGHCPLLIARSDGSIETIESTGPVVGMLPSAQWRSIEVPFGRGDTLLAYTDGVIESRSKSDDEFGLHRLRAAFAGAARRGQAREIAEELQRTIVAHAGQRRDDDLTIIVARR